MITHKNEQCIDVFFPSSTHLIIIVVYTFHTLLPGIASAFWSKSIRVTLFPESGLGNLYQYLGQIHRDRFHEQKILVHESFQPTT
jgi:hypothetical protein